MFSCARNGSNGPPFTVNRATAAPGARVNVVCTLANSGRALSAFDAAWLERLRSGERQWYLVGPPSDGGTYDYKETLARYASEGSHAAAAPYLGALTCNQSLGCLEAKVAWLQSPLYQWLHDAGPAMLAGIALIWLLSFGQRARMARIANFLAIAIVVLFISAIGLFMLNGQSLGMGAVAMRVWAARANPD